MSGFDQNPHPVEHTDAPRSAPPRTVFGRAPETGTESHKPLDLERAIAYLHHAHLSDEAIGYTIRRVAREGTSEQVAAFLAVLLKLLRR